MQALTEKDVQWVVNSNAELGVKIGEQFFFLWKGRSIAYSNAIHEDGSRMRWRPVLKREFGESCHPPPLDWSDSPKPPVPANGIPGGTYQWGDGWAPLPKADLLAGILPAPDPVHDSMFVKFEQLEFLLDKIKITSDVTHGVSLAYFESITALVAELRKQVLK